VLLIVIASAHEQYLARALTPGVQRRTSGVQSLEVSPCC
jgi:hypothetical protein